MKLVRGAKPLCKVPEIGDPVIFYPHATRVGATVTGTIVEADGDVVTINCQSATGSFTRDSVRHVDDETLQYNEHHREFGAWEHAPAFARQWTAVTRLEAILKLLEEKYERTNLPSGRAKKTRDKVAAAITTVNEETEASEPSEELVGADAE